MWLSFHIYDKGNRNRLLCDGIKPFVDHLIKNNFADKFFFIRYFDKASHIRLRISIPNGFEEHSTFNYTEQLEFFCKNAGRDNSNEIPDFKIEAVPYEPEIRRYGGEKGMPVAETQFLYSSNIVLSLLNSKTSYNEIIVPALLLQLILVSIFCDNNLEEMTLFFSLQLHPLKSYSDYKPTDLDSYAVLYEKQKEIFARVIDSYYYQMIIEQISDSILDEWRNNMSLIKLQIDGLMSKDALIFEKEYNNKQHDFWTILESYIHMTNNRLGILNKDEAFLSYILWRRLYEINSHA